MKYPAIYSCLTLFYRRALSIAQLSLSVLILLCIIPGPVSAHRGALDEVDDCRIRVGSEWVHFTAYTPKLTAGKEYCKNIPQLGLTNLVFDYEGKNLRQLTVEFEITKEPAGSRVFYQEPQKIKTGSINGVVDFTQFGEGEYLAHVTIVHKDKKLDTHLPFQVGIEQTSYSGLIKYGSIILIFGVVFIVLVRKANKQDTEPASTDHDDENKADV